MGKKSRRPGSRPGSAAKADPLDRALASTWRSIARGEILSAELHVSSLLAVAYTDEADDEKSERLLAAIIELALEQEPEPVGAAFLRLLAALGPRAAKRAAVAVLAELTGKGVYPPDWVTEIGKPAPGRAWRTYDVYGDRETVAVTFRYPGEAEHVLLVGLDYAELPAATVVLAGEDAAGILKELQDSLEPRERFEEITLAAARQRIEGPLASAEAEDTAVDLDTESVLNLPVARSRVRRLPSDPGGTRASYTAADRAAAVAEFLRSPQAAQAGDPEAARFWAEVLTGYSGRFPGAEPEQTGPLTLTAMLLGHAATTFTLSPAQRGGQAAAVIAWVRWSAARRGLADQDTEHLVEAAVKTLGEFSETYDDAESAALRGYVSDVALSSAEVLELGDVRARRTLAAPFPWLRDARAASVDATTPEGRAALTAYDFASCVPEGQAGAEFTAAASRVVEELWSGQPPETWRTADGRLAAGDTRHQVLHQLIDNQLAG